MENLEIYLDYIGEDSYVYRYDYTSKRYYNTGISLKGNPGNPGRPGKEGKSPHIGENGNWFIGEKDTGVKASGDTGPYKIGILGNAQETEYYTQEEADAYNLENGLSEGDPGFVTTETVKNPAVLHTVKSYVDKQIENLIGAAPEELDTLKEISDILSSAYQKPAGGIPKTDLAQDVKDSLDKADSALQEDTLYEDANGHDYVEIAGMKWATKNIGANAVTDAGLYFQWGDTQGYTAEQVGSGEGKKAFTWADYKFSSDAQGSSMTKYNSTDGKAVLDLADDAARANWGGTWRMPTTEEMQAFGAAVNAVWTDDYQGSGVAGLVCTDKTDNTKVVFFPAAGSCDYGSVFYVGNDGYYWSGSLDTDDRRNVYYMRSDSNNAYWDELDYRCYGYPVRPILDTTQLKKDLDSKANTEDLADVAFSGSYNDLDDKPTIPTVPTNVSAFNNDAGYLTQHQSLSDYVQKSQTAGLIKNDGTIDTNTYLTQHQDISGKADKSEMSVADGTGTDADKTTITLKTGTSATVLKSHQSLSGKQDVIDSSHKLSADLVDDTNTTNKFTNATEKQTWNGKQDALTFNTAPSSNNKVATMADVPTTMGASGSGHKGGLVPDTPSTAGTTKFLREDGTWQEPAGGSAAAYTPTLQSAPTTSTTTYTKDGQTVDFVVGQFARVADANNTNKYDVYQLYDIATENNVTTATWVEVTESTLADVDALESDNVPAVIGSENVLINLRQYTDMSSSTAAVGVVVAVTIDGVTSSFASGLTGTVSFNVAIGKQYTIVITPPEGYYVHGGKTVYEMTAETSSRHFTIRLMPYQTGLFIVDGGGNEYRFDDWKTEVAAGNKSNTEAKLIKIASAQLCEENGVFGIDIDDMRNRNYEKRIWGDSVNINPPGLNTYTYNGLRTTELILDTAAANNNNVPAAQLAYSKTKMVGNVELQGFLGARYQWAILWDVRTEVDEILTYTRPDGEYLLSTFTENKWTSTQLTAPYAYGWGTSASNFTKYTSYSTVVFFAF